MITSKTPENVFWLPASLSLVYWLTILTPTELSFVLYTAGTSQRLVDSIRANSNIKSFKKVDFV